MKSNMIAARPPGLAARLRQPRFWQHCAFFWLLHIALLITFQSHVVASGSQSSMESQTIFVLSLELPALLLIPLLIASGITKLHRTTKTIFAARTMLLLSLIAVITETLLTLSSTIIIPSQLLGSEVPQLTTLSDAFSWYMTQSYWLSDIQKYLFCLAVSFALYWREDSFRNKAGQGELQDKLQVTELALQRAQLNPHFLFNSLNSIAALVRTERSPIALEAITELSQLLREILTNRMQELCTLDSELSLIAHYIQLQKLRFGEKLQFNLEIAPQAQQIQIPTLLLLSLIENAIKHGARSLCQITLSVTQNEQKLVIILRNSLDGQQTQAGFGIGLSNNHKRLELLYQNDFTFETQVNSDEYVVKIQLPIVPKLP